MINNEYQNIIKLINHTFTGEIKEYTLDFLEYLNGRSMIFERLYGYWKNQYYYAVKYNNKIVCFILINGVDDEAQFSPITIWTDDSGCDTYENVYVRGNLKRLAWEHIDYCVHCGSCPGGTQKMIFGKLFDNVCRTSMRFINPDKEEFVLIKKVVSIRKEYIDN